MPQHLEDLRDQLISKVQVGEITPEIAEAQAKEAGLPPLATVPDPAQYDPLKVSRWTFVMAVAWIAWRDLSLVREQQREFSQECRYWFPREWNQPIDNGKRFQKQKGWFLEAPIPPKFRRLLLEQEYMRLNGRLPSTFEFSPVEAELELRRALSDGRLTADGFNRNGDLVEIPAREWPRLQHFEERDRDVFKFHPLDQYETYSEVLFQRDELLREWPRPVGKAKSEIECRRWLIGLMRESPARRTHPKAELRNIAFRKFKPISLRQFNGAWNRAIEEAGALQWKKAGRTPKKSNHYTN